MAITDRIKHVVVLMLENRSFDHMLAGTTFNQPVDQATTNDSNLDTNGKPINVSFNAQIGIKAHPDHLHLGVMLQVTGKKQSKYVKPYNPTNAGFITSFTGISSKKGGPGTRYGAEIMKCQPESNVPVLSTLAKEFAVCDRWFSSVPGETWPNRNYVHAATSHGTVDITPRIYGDPTIFGIVVNAKKDYRVYTDGIAQCLVFSDLWFDKVVRGKFRDFKDHFAQDVAKGDLPEYVFIEPAHFGKRANSQHPGASDNARSFHAGEELIKSVYDALTSNESIWKSTLLIVTYDEHGGFYDHVKPPTEKVVPPDKLLSPEGFGFDMLGLRVPTVLVSPWIKKGAVDSRTFDHSSIPQAVRMLFAPNAKPLTKRDAASENLWKSDIWRDDARNDIPVVTLAPEAHELLATIKPSALTTPKKGPAELPEEEVPWARLAYYVAETIRKEEMGQKAALLMTSWEDTQGRLITSEKDLPKMAAMVAMAGGPAPIVITDSDKLHAFGKDVQKMLEMTAEK